MRNIHSPRNTPCGTCFLTSYSWLCRCPISSRFHPSSSTSHPFLLYPYHAQAAGSLSRCPASPFDDSAALHRCFYDRRAFTTSSIAVLWCRCDVKIASTPTSCRHYLPTFCSLLRTVACRSHIYRPSSFCENKPVACNAGLSRVILPTCFALLACPLHYARNCLSSAPQIVGNIPRCCPIRSVELLCPYLILQF